MRNPDGTYATDKEEALNSWEKVCKDLERSGFHVMGFDPGFLMRFKDNPNGFTVPAAAGSNIARMQRRIERLEEMLKKFVQYNSVTENGVGLLDNDALWEEAESVLFNDLDK